MFSRTAQPTWRFVLVLAFVCALVLTGCGAPAANTSNASSSSEPAKEQTATSTTESTAAANEATAFPSWNPNSESLKTLVDYVNNVTNESSPDYVAPKDRIAPDRIIATDVAYASTNQDDVAFDKYNMTQQDNVVLAEPLGQETGKAGKPIAIAREIGKRPILAFGNSSGDYSMLNYAKSNPKHKGMGVLVLCDDTEREYGDLERAKERTATAQMEGWVLFHMCKDDWATIYGEGVKKTALPGASASANTANAELPAAA